MARDQLKAFLKDIQLKKDLLESRKKASAANEVAEIASKFGYQLWVMN